MIRPLTIAIALTGVALADPCHAPLPKPGTEFSGTVTYVGDGDSLCVGEADGGIEVRLADFDAVELNEPGGREAKAALVSIAMGREMQCLADHRSYDRIVALCAIGGRRLGDLLRASGIVEGGR